MIANTILTKQYCYLFGHTYVGKFPQKSMNTCLVGFLITMVIVVLCRNISPTKLCRNISPTKKQGQTHEPENSLSVCPKMMYPKVTGGFPINHGRMLSRYHPTDKPIYEYYQGSSKQRFRCTRNRRKSVETKHEPWPFLLLLSPHPTKKTPWKSLGWNCVLL